LPSLWINAFPKPSKQFRKAPSSSFALLIVWVHSSSYNVFENWFSYLVFLTT